MLVTLALYMAGIAVLLLYAKFSRRAAVGREARRLGLSYSKKDPFGILHVGFHPFLRYGKLPGTQSVTNVVWGVRDDHEVRSFDYWRAAGDDSIQYSCAMVRIPNGWPTLLVRRHGPLDVARDAAGLRGMEFELETFNRLFEVDSDDRRWASALMDQRMMSQLLESDPVLGFEIRDGWLLVWMPRLEPQELERALAIAEGIHERIPRAVWSLYGGAPPVRTNPNADAPESR